MKGLTFLKLGGSLITDKTRPESVRAEVLERLAGELAPPPGPVLVGHGSGSFGHPAAKRHGVDGKLTADRLGGAIRTQAAAARLARRVVEALVTAGAHPYSWAPSGGLVSSRGVPVDAKVEPLARALDLGLVPVVYGDVVVDREWGLSVCSTEALFRHLARALPAHGWEVRRVLWLGETDGVWDGDGRRMATLDAAEAARLGDAVGGSRGIDVTGGMAHRIEAALDLAGLGVESWILDGRRPAVVAETWEGGADVGTRVPAGGQGQPRGTRET